MALYRTGTYVAFHANGTAEPTESDMKYYRLLCAWKEHEHFDIEFIDSHEKSAAVRDSSSKARLWEVLKERLRASKNMILIVGQTTKQDADWIPREIQYAVDDCKIPIIAAYPGQRKISNPAGLSHLWPQALTDRIINGSAKVIHIPFLKEPICEAIKQFDFNNLPATGKNYYNDDAYRSWSIS